MMATEAVSGDGHVHALVSHVDGKAIAGQLPQGIAALGRRWQTRRVKPQGTGVGPVQVKSAVMEGDINRRRGRLAIQGDREQEVAVGRRRQRPQATLQKVDLMVTVVDTNAQARQGGNRVKQFTAMPEEGRATLLT